MARLSLMSAQHNAPPYEDMGQGLNDQPRKMLRLLRKKLGLPASDDVNALAGQIRNIIDAFSFECPITKAAISIPHLAALYQDDLEDGAEYANILYLPLPLWNHPILWETAAAFAGYGLGLCQNYEDDEKCSAEYERMRHWDVLATHFPHRALTTSITNMWNPFGFTEQPARHAENFSLGYDMLGRAPGNEIDYWKQVHKQLYRATRHQGYHFPDPDLILVTGDTAHHSQFISELQNSVMIRNPVVLNNDTMLAVAKGTAEMLFRRQVHQRNFKPPNITGYSLQGKILPSRYLDI